MDESKPTPGAAIRMADAIRYRDGLMIALARLYPAAAQEPRRT